MNGIVFDSGPIISLTTNNLLWVLDKLNEIYSGDLFITPKVHDELVKNPLRTKKYKYEAIQVQRLIDKGILKILKSSTKKEFQDLYDLANKSFYCKNKPLNLFHNGELEVLILAQKIHADLIIMDERSTRMLIEKPKKLKTIIEHHLHSKVSLNNFNIDSILRSYGDLKIIRSTELITVAFEKGLFKDYIVNIDNARKTLLNSLLWGLKLHGCAITKDEIDEIITYEK